mmetsp:Transcript_37467/g.85175  ORF Transcript_37467/g.85175 Transcript_37467/m.85175 type:complete len:380 (-) Transcript_37467:298-1437(-)
MLAYCKKLGFGNTMRVMIGAISGPIQCEAPPTQYAQAALEKLPADLVGKTFAVTGTSRGIGLQLAKTLASRNGTVFLLNRSSPHATKALEEVRAVNDKAKVFAIDCDLTSFASVKACAKALKEHEAVQARGLYALVCNAGVMALKYAPTADGYDPQMQANHLSHFLLTHELWSELQRAAEPANFGEARVIQHSSGARNTPEGPLVAESFWTKEELDKEGKSLGSADEKFGLKWRRYQQSKRANLAFTYALGDLIESLKSSGKGGNVKALCAHPGATNSGLQGRTEGEKYMDRLINGLACFTGMSVEDGALGISLATLEEGAGNKDFYGPAEQPACAEKLPCEDDLEDGKYSKEIKSLLWSESMRATGLLEAGTWPATLA